MIVLGKYDLLLHLIKVDGSEFGKNMIIFGADMNLSVRIDNKKKGNWATEEILLEFALLWGE